MVLDFDKISERDLNVRGLVSKSPLAMAVDVDKISERDLNLRGLVSKSPLACGDSSVDNWSGALG